MVHASIISRILLWYQQAAGWTYSASSQPRLVNSPRSSSITEPLHSEQTDSTTQTSSAPKLAQSTGFVVEHVPVSVGMFGVEDQNMQDAFKDQLILSELKGAAILIDVFTSEDSSEPSATDIAGHLGAWLRGEHSRIVKFLTARLSALNKDIDLG